MPSRLTRAILAGALAVIVTAALVTQAEMVLSTVRIGYLQLPPVALGLLLAILGVNRLVQRLSNRLGLARVELLVIYVMMLVGAMVSSHGIAEKLVPLLVIPNYFAGQNNSGALFGPTTPHQLVPYNPTGGPRQAVAAYYYEKLPRGFSVPWHAWVTPLLTWGILIGLMLFAFLCLASILRRSWTDHEKLIFPLAQLPIQLTTEGETSVFHRPALWFGVLVPVLIYTLNGIHQSFPAMPQVLLTISLNDYLVTAPWNRLDYTPILISFAAIGFFYLLPRDLLLSIWFFFILSRLAQIGAASLNAAPDAIASSLRYQTVGAYITLVGAIVLSSKHHFKDIWLTAIGRRSLDDGNELLPYHVAVWGLIGAVLLSAIWLWCMGMTLWLALFELAVCLFLIAPVMARSTAEAGMLMTETTFRPIDIYTLVAPAHGLGLANLTMISFFDSMFLQNQRGLVLTGFLDGLRIAEAANIPRRRLLPAFIIGPLVALVVAVTMNIFLPYRIGALNMDHWMEQGSSRWIFGNDALIASGSVQAQPAWATAGSTVGGAVVTMLLLALRRSWYWWPLQPLGYALLGTWSTTQFWFPCLTAWIFKSLSTRYGGSKFVAQVTPFFLGLVVGEFGMAVLYVFLNAVLHIQPPPFPWS